MPCHGVLSRRQGFRQRCNVTSAGLSALRVSFPVATACCCGPVTVTPLNAGSIPSEKLSVSVCGEAGKLRPGGRDSLPQVSVGEGARRG